MKEEKREVLGYSQSLIIKMSFQYEIMSQIQNKNEVQNEIYVLIYNGSQCEVSAAPALSSAFSHNVEQHGGLPDHILLF